MNPANLFHLGSGKIETLHQLFIEQLRDLYSAEKQLVDALPEMAEASHDAALKKGFLSHLDETKGHVARLEILFEQFEEDPDGKTCHAMKGLIKEGKEAINENATPGVKDAALIAAAQRVEHYEMAGYGTVRTFAEIMGHDEAVSLLQETLDEEGRANKTLTTAAKKINAGVPTGHGKSRVKRAL